MLQYIELKQFTQITFVLFWVLFLHYIITENMNVHYDFNS